MCCLSCMRLTASSSLRPRRCQHWLLEWRSTYLARLLHRPLRLRGVHQGWPLWGESRALLIYRRLLH